MKLIKCKKCGNVYPRKTGYCPKCATLAPKGKGGIIATIIVICLFAFAATMGILFGEETPDSSSTNNSSVQNEKTSTENVYKQSKELITFNGVDAEFIELYDPNTGVTALAVKLNLENKSNKTVTVTLTDGYVNDTLVQFMTGLPVTIEPNKKAVGVYMFGYDGLGFSKVEDIQTIEFKLALLDESYNIETSEKITLNFK